MITNEVVSFHVTIITLKSVEMKLTHEEGDVSRGRITHTMESDWPVSLG